MLLQWVRAHQANPTHALRGEGQQKPEQAELTRLRKEVVRLTMARDILKKWGQTSWSKLRSFDVDRKETRPG